MKRTFAVLLLLCLSLLGQTRIVSPVWVQGDGASHAVDATEVARWLTVLAAPSNATTNCSTSDLSKCPVVGGTTVAIGTQGIPLLPGASYTFQVLPPGQPGYSLAQIHYAASVGDKVMLIWAK